MGGRDTIKHVRKTQNNYLREQEAKSKQTRTIKIDIPTVKRR